MAPGPGGRVRRGGPEGREEREAGARDRPGPPRPWGAPYPGRLTVTSVTLRSPSDPRPPTPAPRPDVPHLPEAVTAEDA